MKKKILSFALSMCMLFSCAAFLPRDAFAGSITAAAESTKSGDYTYGTLSDGTITITAYSGTATTLTVPETLDGKTVTRVAQYAFRGNTTLKSVTVGGSITNVEYGAFQNCSALESITFKSGIKAIGRYACSGCSNLSKVTAASTLENVWCNAFSGTKWLTEQRKAGSAVVLAGCLIDVTASGAYTVPSTVKAICEYAFYYDSVTSVTIPSGVKAIGNSAFYNCSSLTSVSIPASVTSIEDSVFYNCSKLSSITVASANQNFSASYGVLYDKNKTELIYCPKGKTSVTIPSTVKTIRKAAFENCKELTSITLPSGLTTVGGYAFRNCTSLSSATFSGTDVEASGYLFYGCTALKTVKLPTKLTKLTYGFFYGCTALESVTIPNTVTAIESSVFYNCTSLKSVNIPSALTTIGGNAFYNCSSLKSMTIPKTVTSVGSGAIGYISQSGSVIDPSFKLRCYKGTAAEDYGYKSGVNYELIDSTDAPGFATSGAFKLDTAPFSPYSANDRSFGIFGNDKNNGVYVISSSKLYFISAANGKTTKVYDFSAANADSIFSSYACGSKLYAAGSHYDGSVSKTVYHIYVYDLDAKKLLSTITPPTAVSAVGADASGNIYTYGDSKLSKLSSTGKVICETAADNAIYRFTGFDETKGYLYYEGYYNWIYWGYPHSMTSLFSATVTANSITLNDSPLDLLYQNYYYDHNKSADLLGGKYLTFANNYITCVNSNTFDPSSDSISALFKIQRPNLEGDHSGQDYWSYGTRAAYCKLYDSVVYYAGDNTLIEMDKTGAKVSEYNNLSHAFAMCSVGYNIVVIDQHDTRCYYLEVVPWKHPSKVILNTSAVSLKNSATYQLTASTDSVTKAHFTWTSSNPKVAAVSKDGKVYATGVGTATITVQTNGGIKASCKVTVTANSALTVINEQHTTIGASSTNASANDYTVWSKTNKSYLYEDTSKNLWRAEYTGSKITVEKYSAGAANLLSRYTVTPELSIFGGIYFSSDYNYVVTGQKNASYSDNTEVVRVTRYTKDWKKKDHVSIKGANTYIPFDAGSCRFTEINGKIYIHTCHEMYADSSGVNHQANMTFILDKATMKITDSQYGVDNLTSGYVSHSFDQFVQSDNGYVYRVDHAEGNFMTMNGSPLSTRGITISRIKDGDALTAVSVAVPVEAHGGTGGNYTGIALGGFEVSKDSLIVAYTTDIGTSSALRNVCLSVTDKNEFTKKDITLTSFDSSSKTRAGTPQLVKVSDNLFAVLWEEKNTTANTYCVKAMLIDGQGNKCSAEGKMTARLSDCQPILCSDGCIRWYVTNGGSPVFYSIQPFEIGTLHEHNFSKSPVTKKATCTANGLRTYTCSDCGKTKTETIKATGHSWNTPKYTWSSDGKSCTVTRVCKTDSTHVQTVMTAKRLSGSTRFETATKIADDIKSIKGTTETVVLVNSEKFADALAGVPYSFIKNAPILLAPNPKDSQHDTKFKSTLDEIKKLGAKNVIILGGNFSVSKEKAEDVLVKQGYTVTRIKGSTRYETATNIAEKVNSAPTEVFIVYSQKFPDALAISSIAAQKKAPILYVDKKGTIDANTKAYLTKHKATIKKAYVIGGTGAVSDDVKSQIDKTLGITSTRIKGSTRYETCLAVLNYSEFKSFVNGTELCVTTGEKFPDALAGGVLAAMTKSPVMLVNGKQSKFTLTDTQKTFLKSRSTTSMTILGGAGAIPNGYVNTITSAVI